MKMETGRNGMRTESGRIVTGGLLVIWILAAVGCSSPQPVKGPPSPSNQDVRSHADRAFDKLTEEERQGRDVTQPMR
ncbi:MAG TPA: hypothetical protein VLA99_01740 [Nitrospiraceae bacterium]|nr:hypothetical protein [Nitrospiraceae bacterium]